MEKQTIPSFYGLPDEHGNAFRFTSVKERFSGMGGVTSCFQSDPLYGPSSDWQIEARNSTYDTPCHVYWTQKAETFPHMMRNSDPYFNRARELNNTMFRISFEMAWLCPRINEFNEEVMSMFVRMLAQIKMRGMEPMVALYHWVIPCSLLKFDSQSNIVRGGWDNPGIIPYFRFYIERVMNFLADDDKVADALDGLNLDQSFRDALIAEGLVQYFITINEPSSILAPCYLAGMFPPFKTGRIDLLEPVLRRLVEAHDIAYATIKETLDKKGINTCVGVGHQWHYCEGVLKGLMQSRLPYLSNEKLSARFERDGRHTDFFGLQYYYRFHLTGRFFREGKLFLEHPDLGDIYPPGLLYNLRLVSKQYPGKPIKITEFGFADSTDRMKPYLILETLRYACQARQEGIPVDSMLLWTLVNNFEWACGMNVPFGLFKESDLKEMFTPSARGRIASWEAWQYACQALTDPTSSSLLELQACYEIATRQFERQF